MKSWDYVINLVGNKTSCFCILNTKIDNILILSYFTQRNVVVEQRGEHIVFYHKDFRVI